MGELVKNMIESLIGLSVGDAYGENMLRILPPGVREYSWTDDTAMAIGIVQCIKKYREINQYGLMEIFSDNHNRDRHRGYGRSTSALCLSFVYDKNWELSSRSAFNGQGSCGNGAAMRVAPLGAWFQDDLSYLVEEARKSAEVTHWNPEAIAGAIAVAVATACVCTNKPYWENILKYTPTSEVRTRIESVAYFNGTATNEQIALDVGNGSKVTAMDTVPYAIWCAHEAIELGEYSVPIQNAAKVGGDIDTYCAMIGGIIGAVYPPPKEWVDRTEPLPASVTEN